MQRMREVGFWNAFIRDPIPTKEMLDGVQSANPKTPSCSFVVVTAFKRAKVLIIIPDMMEEIMECWPRTLPLHLKIAAWQGDQRRMGYAPPLDLSELKTILLPRQALLKKLDPTGELSVPKVRAQLEPLVRQYERLIIQDRVDGGTQRKDALKIYKYFHQLNSAQEWGEIALSCTCRVCFANCACKDTLLFVSLFKQGVRVPNSYVTATPSLRKKCKSIKGTAGRKRRGLIEERKCDEKITDSKSRS
jgi:hypothetical protein